MMVVDTFVLLLYQRKDRNEQAHQIMVPITGTFGTPF